MPHNLYLHSALVQTRRIDDTEAARKTACKYNLIDSLIALCCAMFVNMAILVMAAAVFFANGKPVHEMEGEAHQGLLVLAADHFALIIYGVPDSMLLT